MQTPLQTPIQTPLPGSGDGIYNIPTGPNDYPASGNDTAAAGGSGNNNTETKSGRPSPYMVKSTFSLLFFSVIFVSGLVLMICLYEVHAEWLNFICSLNGNFLCSCCSNLLLPG